MSENAREHLKVKVDTTFLKWVIFVFEGHVCYFMQNVIHIRSSYVHTFIDEVCLSAIAAATDVGNVHSSGCCENRDIASRQ